jgi:hypothetical protein
MDALLNIVKMLYITRDQGVTLRPGDSMSAATLVRLRGYADCSYATHGNGKSHYSHCFDLVEEKQHDERSPLQRIFQTGMFYFKSYMAPTVDLATAEGEAGALIECAKDAIFYRGFLNELHLQQIHPTPLYGDNDSTIILATEYGNKHRRVRYMLPKIMWLMEQTKTQVLKLLRLGTKELPPDVGTKIGGGIEFQRKMDRVMGSKII